MALCSTFRDSIRDPNHFTLTFELVPGRTRKRDFDQIICFAEEAARQGRLNALSITENAGGHPALSPAVVGREIQKLGLEALIHFSCKDKNRNQIESTLFARYREGLHTLLIMTGDFPRYGFMGQAKPVFDLDAVHLLQMITQMEKGFELPTEAPGGGVKLPPMPFFKGCVVSPFKRLEAEVMTQYYKLHRKVAAGAHFVITQVGFDARKFDELKRYMGREGLNIPLIGGVMILSRGLARLIYQGAIPGIYISKKLLSQIEKEYASPKEGYKAALRRAARLAAILHGLGYNGVHFCGMRPRYEDMAYLLAKMDEYLPSWREFVPEFQNSPEGTFYYFQKDPQTGLNTDEPTPRPKPKKPPVFYMINQLFHDMFFEPHKKFYPLAQKIARKVKGSRLEYIFTRWEYALKWLLFNCQECGDCALGELAYLCPHSQCAKGLRNGPCGGSINGWCEVYPGRKRCFYVQVYERLKAVGREEELKNGFMPPRDWSLDKTSSWLNFYLGLDHHRFKKSSLQKSKNT